MNFALAHIYKNNPTSEETYSKYFDIIADFNWKSYEKEFNRILPYLPEWEDGIPTYSELPKWLLLKRKNV